MKIRNDIQFKISSDNYQTLKSATPDMLTINRYTKFDVIVNGNKLTNCNVTSMFTDILNNFFITLTYDLILLKNIETTVHIIKYNKHNPQYKFIGQVDKTIILKNNVNAKIKINNFIKL